MFKIFIYNFQNGNSMFKLKKQKTEQKKGENIIYKFSFFFRFNNFDLGIQEFKIIF